MGGYAVRRKRPPTLSIYALPVSELLQVKLVMSIQLTFVNTPTVLPASSILCLIPPHES